MLIRAKQLLSHYHLATLITDSVTYAPSSPVAGATWSGVSGLFWTVEQDDKEETITVKGDAMAFANNRDVLEDAHAGTELTCTSVEVGKTHHRCWVKMDEFTWQLIVDNLSGENVPESENNLWNLEEQNLLIKEKSDRRDRLIKQSEAFKASDNRFGALAALKR